MLNEADNVLIAREALTTGQQMRVGEMMVQLPGAIAPGYKVGAHRIVRGGPIRKFESLPGRLAISTLVSMSIAIISSWSTSAIRALVLMCGRSTTCRNLSERLSSEACGPMDTSRLATSSHSCAGQLLRRGGQAHHGPVYTRTACCLPQRGRGCCICTNDQLQAAVAARALRGFTAYACRLCASPQLAAVLVTGLGSERN
ncbi:hypothetical protein SAMN05216337_101065 [Bradyrhizobium brasilense]|uniref:Uncharacterized protein n=1 Tax=Bradyrhizobium brasilense TaxID=1419277 RepID=A0A1G6U105_9BRAD|nr:hypothetical protein SAMN05216337_101065 [Bradyrhizobium brasilense]